MNEGSRRQYALSGKAWSLARTLESLGNVIDTQKRPVHERRADSSVRKGVPFDVATCAYGDARDGMFLNKSALDQVNAQLKKVLADVRAFRALVPAELSPWRAMLCAVSDSYLAPALHLLLSDDSEVPVQSAVSHKLAAGYFGVLRRLLFEGHDRDVEASPESFLSFVDQTRALVGKSEACGGPPKQIAYLSRALWGEQAPTDDSVEVAPYRLPVAMALAEQVLLGIVWQLADMATESLLLGSGSGEELPFDARNHFIGERLSKRCAAIADHEPQALLALARHRLAELDHPAIDSPIAEAMASEAPQGAELIPHLRELMGHGDGALRLRSEDQLPLLAHTMSLNLRIRRAVDEAQNELEQRMRVALGFDADAPVQLGPTVMPRSKSQGWFEAILGHKITSYDQALVLESHKRRVEIPL